MGRKDLTAGQTRLKRSDRQAEENSVCDFFNAACSKHGYHRKPRQFAHVLPQPLGSDEISTEFRTDIDFNPTIILNERTATKVLGFRAQKRCSRKHRTYSEAPK